MELTFKVVDQNGDALNDVNIEITNDQDESETVMIEANGEAKATNKYGPGTELSVTVEKEGYSLVTDVTQGITVDARQSENTFSFEMSIKSVSTK